jgi:hypothetical protein
MMLHHSFTVGVETSNPLDRGRTRDLSLQDDTCTKVGTEIGGSRLLRRIRREKRTRPCHLTVDKPQ